MQRLDLIWVNNHRFVCCPMHTNCQPSKYFAVFIQLRRRRLNQPTRQLLSNMVRTGLYSLQGPRSLGWTPQVCVQCNQNLEYWCHWSIGARSYTDAANRHHGMRILAGFRLPSPSKPDLAIYCLAHYSFIGTIIWLIGLSELFEPNVSQWVPTQKNTGIMCSVACLRLSGTWRH